jgi:hypothetical protein
LQLTPAIEAKYRQKLHFLHVGVVIYLNISTIFTFLCGGVAAVKSMDFEQYPSIATRGTARR